MKRKTKRFTAFLLTFLLLIGLMPASVFAETEEDTICFTKYPVSGHSGYEYHIEWEYSQEGIGPTKLERLNPDTNEWESVRNINSLYGDIPYGTLGTSTTYRLVGLKNWNAVIYGEPFTVEWGPFFTVQPTVDTSGGDYKVTYEVDPPGRKVRLQILREGNWYFVRDGEFDTGFSETTFTIPYRRGIDLEHEEYGDSTTYRLRADGFEEYSEPFTIYWSAAFTRQPVGGDASSDYNVFFATSTSDPVYLQKWNETLGSWVEETTPVTSPFHIPYGTEGTTDKYRLRIDADENVFSNEFIVNWTEQQAKYFVVQPQSGGCTGEYTFTFEASTAEQVYLERYAGNRWIPGDPVTSPCTVEWTGSGSTTDVYRLRFGSEPAIYSDTFEVNFHSPYFLTQPVGGSSAADFTVSFESEPTEKLKYFHIQKWNGLDWINYYNYDGPTSDNTVTIHFGTAGTTDRFRLGWETIYGMSYSEPFEITWTEPGFVVQPEGGTAPAGCNFTVTYDIGGDEKVTLERKNTGNDTFYRVGEMPATGEITLPDYGEGTTCTYRLVFTRGGADYYSNTFDIFWSDEIFKVQPEGGDHPLLGEDHTISFSIMDHVGDAVYFLEKDGGANYVNWGEITSPYSIFGQSTHCTLTFRVKCVPLSISGSHAYYSEPFTVTWGEPYFETQPSDVVIPYNGTASVSARFSETPADVQLQKKDDGTFYDYKKLTAAQDISWTFNMLSEEGEYRLAALADGIYYYSDPFKVTVNEYVCPFVDVNKDDPNHWFYTYVEYVDQNRLMTGYSNTPPTFGPYDQMNRAMFAMVLYRMEHEPEGEYPNKFPDVYDGAWYTKAVCWAAGVEVVTGYSSTGLFGTNDYITREQMAVMMYRYATKVKGLELDASGDLSGFADASYVSDFAETAMKWATGNGIITGKTGGMLDPQGYATRAECATILTRFCQTYGIF